MWCTLSTNYNQERSSRSHDTGVTQQEGEDDVTQTNVSQASYDSNVIQGQQTKLNFKKKKENVVFLLPMWNGCAITHTEKQNTCKKHDLCWSQCVLRVKRIFISNVKSESWNSSSLQQNRFALANV